MNMAEWIDIGITNGVVDMPEIEEKTFEEIYKQRSEEHTSELQSPY